MSSAETGVDGAGDQLAGGGGGCAASSHVQGSEIMLEERLGEQVAWRQSGGRG